MRLLCLHVFIGLLGSWLLISASGEPIGPDILRETGPSDAPDPQATARGVLHTTVDEEAFSRPLPDLPDEMIDTFMAGRNIFNRDWSFASVVAQPFDGLGPIFNRASCSGCHIQNGRGRPPLRPDERIFPMVLRLSIAGAGQPGGEPVPHPAYGHQLDYQSRFGLPIEGHTIIDYEHTSSTFADGTSYELRTPSYRFASLKYGPIEADVLFSPRLTVPVFGLGLLEAVSEDDVLAWADADDHDGDGISGRPNWILDGAGGRQLGRFGWKANQANLRSQTTAALNRDMGITSSDHPGSNCTAAQKACLDAPTGGEPEISDERLAELVAYMQLLAVPAPRDQDDPVVRRGAQIFRQVGCDSCHRPSFETSPTAAHPQLASQRFEAYTDLLLHDMGPELADGRPDYSATGREWRTPPLWGLGLTGVVNDNHYYLHDGRARSLLEAILWHGGEAAAARDSVRSLDAADRDALVRFVESI